MYGQGQGLSIRIATQIYSAGNKLSLRHVLRTCHPLTAAVSPKSLCDIPLTL